MSDEERELARKISEKYQMLDPGILLSGMVSMFTTQIEIMTDKALIELREAADKELVRRKDSGKRDSFG